MPFFEDLVAKDGGRAGILFPSKNLLWLYLCYVKEVAVQILKQPVLVFFKVCLCKSGNDRSEFF